MLAMGCSLSVVAWGWGERGSEVLLLLKLQDIAITLGHSPWLHDNPITEDITCFSGSTKRNQAGIELKASSLLGSFHNSRNCYAGFREREAISDLT